MWKNGCRLGAIGLSTVAFVGLGRASAFAATPTTDPQSLAAVQAKAAAAITLRLDDLNEAMAKARATSRLGSSGAPLVSYLQADVAPLQALGTKIAGDTTVTGALTDSSTIFTSYRVLALVLPAAHVAATADAIDVTAIPSLTAISANAALHVNSSNGASLQPLIGDLNAQIQSAGTATANVASSLLAFTALQWNANHDLLAPSRRSVQAAMDDVTKARNDVQQIRSLLRAPTPSATNTPTTAT
jgi:hypothetical protein